MKKGSKKKKSLWHYAVNQFMNSTINSMKKAMRMSIYHYGFLKAKKIKYPGDPDWAYLFNRYEPLHLAFLDAYNKWVAAGGLQGGDTLTVMEFLSKLASYVDAWMVMALNHYIKKSARFKALFPRLRKPFNRGPVGDRLIGIKALSEVIGDDPNLVAMKADVDARHDELETALKSQEGKFFDTGTGSKDARKKKDACMKMMYGTTGFLMNKYMDKPELIIPFFEQEELRTIRQTTWNLKIKLLTKKGVFCRTVLAEDELRIKVEFEEGATKYDSVTFYLGSFAGATDSAGILFLDQEELKFLFSKFGVTDYSKHRFLTAVNNSTGKFVKIFLQIY
jgi:hypothetical protein